MLAHEPFSFIGRRRCCGGHQWYRGAAKSPPWYGQYRWSRSARTGESENRAPDGSSATLMLGVVASGDLLRGDCSEGAVGRVVEVAPFRIHEHKCYF